MRGGIVRGPLPAGWRNMLIDPCAIPRKLMDQLRGRRPVQAGSRLHAILEQGVQLADRRHAICCSHLEREPCHVCRWLATRWSSATWPHTMWIRGVWAPRRPEVRP